ncbi:MAG: MATE family efflux transporter [Pseudomonadota bacterium]
MIENVDRKSIIKFAFPLILTGMSYIMMTTVDAIFVGRLGVSQIAAVGLSGFLIWAFYNFFTGIPLSVNTFVSQHFGAKNYSKTIVSVYNGMLIIIISSLLLFFIRIFTPEILKLMKPSQEVQKMAVIYTQMRLMGAPFYLANYVFASFYRGIGDNKIILKINIVINIINIFLDYILIFGFSEIKGMGIKGAAIATVISQLIGTLAYIVLFYKFKCEENKNSNYKLRFDSSELVTLVKVGFPRGLAMFAELFAAFVFVTLLGRLGDAQLAASTIMLQIVLFSNITALGLGRAGASLIGQFIGAKRKESAYKSGYYSAEINFTFTVMFSVLLIINSKNICSIFNTDPNVILFFDRIVVFGAIFVCFDGLQIIMNYCLGGAGDTKYPLYIILVVAYLIFIPLVYLLAFHFEYGIWGAWLASSIFIVLYGTLLFYRFVKKRWQMINLMPA